MNITQVGERQIGIVASMATRHGLITGATGSGKTVSIKLLAEQFSNLGVPVFIQDVKGDLSGFVTAGYGSDKFLKHIAKYGGSEPQYQAFPTVFWDIFGESGHPLRTTVSEMGPLMLSRLLQLNETQTGIVYTVFRIADDKGWLLLDLKDFIALLDHVASERKTYQVEYGSISTQSVGAIKRKLLMLESDGLSNLFGEPALDIADLMRLSDDGKGVISLLDAQKLAQTPSTYASFLLWLLSELFETLPEAGDVDKPKLVFFFDEAHILFSDMPKFLLEKVEQVVKLIRSKGVAVFFVTQNPADIPDAVLAQLGNRIQHVLRAYTPKEKKAVKVAAQSFRENPEFKTADAISELGVGEALVSFLDDDGVPGIVQRGYMLAPSSLIGPGDVADVKAARREDTIGNKYDKLVDRESAYEILTQKAAAQIAEKDEREAWQIRQEERRRAAEKKQSEDKAKPKSKRRTDSAMDKFLKSASTAIGSQLGRSLIRGIMGSFTKRR